MSRPKILVMGATGRSGAAVVTALRQADWPVRAIVRGEDTRSERLRRLGAETVVADPFSAEQLLEALRGTERAYYLPFFHPFALQAAVAFADAARVARLEQVVQMSQWVSGPDHPAAFTRQTWLIDRLFASLDGIAHTIVNPGFFADNSLRLLDFAAVLGVFPILTGDSLNAPPSNEDIGRVAAAILMDPAPYAGRSYRPTGPTLLSARDLLPVIGKVLGHGVAGVDLPWFLFARAARLQGESAFVLENFFHYLEDHRQGAFARGAPNDVVAQVTGRPAEDLETVVARYAALPFARRSARNRLRVLAGLMRVPFAPGVPVDRRVTGRGEPSPRRPRAAMGDADWKASHPPRDGSMQGGAIGAASGGLSRSGAR